MVESKCRCSCTSSNTAKAVIGWNVSRDWLRHSENDGDLSLSFLYTEQMCRLLESQHVKELNGEKDDGEVILKCKFDYAGSTHARTHTRVT